MSNYAFNKKFQQHHEKFNGKLTAPGHIKLEPKYVKIMEKKAKSVSEFRDEVIELRKKLDKKAMQNSEINKKEYPSRAIAETLKNVKAKIEEYDADLNKLIEEEYKAHINNVLGDLQEKLDRIDSRNYPQFKEEKKSLTKKIDILYNKI